MANPIDVEIVGQALMSYGLVGNDTVEGLGLNTFGFLWPLDGIWVDCGCYPTETVWVECEDC